jgi:hypothetical protein
MLRIENPRAGLPLIACTAPFLMLALPSAACSSERQPSATAEAELGCSAVRREQLKAREQIEARVERARAAVETARRTEKPQSALDREFRSLMEDIERAEGRFAARSKECVGD